MSYCWSVQCWSCFRIDELAPNQMPHDRMVFKLQIRDDHVISASLSFSHYPQQKTH